ncbi:DUF805 domain-containing protein, partial [Escherichia coli]|uniref:DUF805 domain-containing protein n=3 Tax=Escherichia coli TaxID=562 RepID=UPI003CEDAECC
ADRNRSHWSTSKTPSYTKSVSWQHHLNVIQLILGLELPYLSMLYLLATFLPVLALAIRRLHDTDRSGAWALLFFVPFIGWLVLLVFFCTEGTSGSNRYGNDPKFGSN